MLMFAVALACSSGSPVSTDQPQRTDLASSSVESAARGPEPASVAAEPPNADQPEDDRPIGWWRGDSVCLELFDNGDFELSDLGGKGPKVLVMGRVGSVEDAGGKQQLALEVARIWRARWAGPCRKRHQLGGWVDEHRVLGRAFAKGQNASVTVQRLDEETLELCADACVELHEEAPVLGARWRRPENSELELVELELDQTVSKIVVDDGGRLPTIYGKADATLVADDTFELTFEPDASIPGGAKKSTLFGAPLREGQTRTFTARRLAQQRLEICDQSKHCATLQRQFEAHHYDLR